MYQQQMWFVMLAMVYLAGAVLVGPLLIKACSQVASNLPSREAIAAAVHAMVSRTVSSMSGIQHASWESAAARSSLGFSWLMWVSLVLVATARERARLNR